MKPYFKSFLGAAFLLGCSSVSQKLEVRQPSQGNTAARVRSYEQSLSCKLLEDGSEDLQRERISALSGFAVGPQVPVSLRNPSSAVLRPFTSDGCSSSPDGIPLTENSEVWVDCCVQHDTSYWIGGTHEQKHAADEQLKSCISEKGYPRIGSMYKLFVDKFGGPKSTQNYRWGYGWNYKRGYKELDADEQQQIHNMYGVSSSEVSKIILAKAFKLQKNCDTFDPVFWGFHGEEVKAYQYLNRRLEKPDVIEWARWSYYNTERRTLLMKMKGCEDLVSLTFMKGTTEPKLQSSCY